jgi:hypothetical protein
MTKLETGFSNVSSNRTIIVLLPSGWDINVSEPQDHKASLVKKMMKVDAAILQESVYSSF